MTELAYLSIAQAGRLIRKRELSPVDLTEALLGRIAAIDPVYHAFIAVTADIARAEAKAAETEIADGRWRGPMHGVPYALKDIFDVAGLPTTCHSKLRIGHRATADAAVVRRLRDAGAVLLGKLSLHEFANGGPTLELPWPAARNPWNTDLHPGGSSSGCGTATATGMVPATLGTDTGGSVRNPATCCGVIGMKPTYGAVSRSGVFPLAFSLDHVGPITRTVEDNAILFQAIAGHDPADPASARHPHADCIAGLRQGVKGLRIGVIAHFYEEDMEADPEQVAAIEAAIAQLAPARRAGQAGAAVAAGALDGLRPHHPLRRGLCDPRARPAGTPAGLCGDHSPAHARRRIHRGLRVRQGAAVAHRPVRGVPRGAARRRRADHAVELRPAVPHRRRRRDRAYL